MLVTELTEQLALRYSDIEPLQDCRNIEKSVEMRKC